MSTQFPIGFHIVRFGIASDQKFLLGDFLSSYDHLIINANTASHMPSALASFLSVRAKNKPYFIDPMTHAFQHEIEHIESTSQKRLGEIKRSVQKLIDSYGAPINTCINKEHRSVRPRDFTNGILKQFCNRVLEFQTTVIANEAEQSDAAKYYAYLRKQKGQAIARISSPSILVAPYFYLTQKSMASWLPVNISCANISSKLAKSMRQQLGVQLTISQDILFSSRSRKILIEEYSKIKPDVFMLWIDSFSEQNASEDELRALIELIRELGKVTPIVNLYGGFFSVALKKLGICSSLKGVAHGLEYGESRGVIPVGGGFPSAKFYFPSLHHRLLFRDAFRAIRAVGGVRTAEHFYQKVCDCKMCRETISSNPEGDFHKYGETRPITYKVRGRKQVKDYTLPETRTRTAKHYMYCKKAEYRTTYSNKQVIEELRHCENILSKAFGSQDLRYCTIWANIIEQETNDS